MTDSDNFIGQQAAQQGLGMPANASPTTQDAYYREQSRMRGDSGALGAIGMPRPPMNAGGLWFIVLLPILAIWFVVMDLVRGWRKWRVIGLLLGFVVAAVTFGLMVYVGVQQELSGMSSQASENSPAIVLMMNIGTGAICAMILFLVPRTIVAVTVLVGIISAWNTWITPLLQTGA